MKLDEVQKKRWADLMTNEAEKFGRAKYGSEVSLFNLFAMILSRPDDFKEVGRLAKIRFDNGESAK